MCVVSRHLEGNLKALREKIGRCGQRELSGRRGPPAAHVRPLQCVRYSPAQGSPILFASRTPVAVAQGLRLSVVQSPSVLSSQSPTVSDATSGWQSLLRTFASGPTRALELALVQIA